LILSEQEIIYLDDEGKLGILTATKSEGVSDIDIL
jgi:hypothetical protein